MYTTQPFTECYNEINIIHILLVISKRPLALPGAGKELPGVRNDHHPHSHTTCISGTNQQSHHTYFNETDLHPHYTWFNGTDLLHGKTFNVKPELLQSLRLPPPVKYTEMTRKTVRSFVFVTAASKNHFVESIDAIARVQMFFPRYPILYYDLGLDKKQIKEVGNRNVAVKNGESCCNFTCCFLGQVTLNQTSMGGLLHRLIAYPPSDV